MTVAEMNELVQRPIGRRDLAERSPHFVAGRTSKADNPHLYRLSFFEFNGRESRLKKWSPAMRAYLKELDAQPQETPSDTVSERASRPPEFARALAEHAARKRAHAAILTAADRANKRKPPLIWNPIPAERAEHLAQSRIGRCGPLAWPAAHREKVIAAAQKRGDVIPNIPNILQDGTP